MTREMPQRESHECIRCGMKITKEECETYSDLCEECHEAEIDELDFEDDYGV